MSISRKVFTEKKEAGAALLAVCKDMKAVDAAMDIGNYQGFNMRIHFDSWSKEFILSVKHESVSKVHLGADALRNITRINNLLESYPEKLAEAEQRLETVQEQLTNAKEEVGKPFTKEEELNQKLENRKRKKNDRHVVLSMRNCRFIKKKASGKARMAGKIEKGTSVWNKKTGKMA